MLRRITASEIVSLLMYKERDIKYRPNISYHALEEGKRIHNRLGFDNAWLFRRYIFVDEEWWLVLGQPDKIDEKNGVILELKTHQTRTAPDKLLTSAEIQCKVYCWLTGMLKYAVYTYSVYSGKKQKRLEKKADLMDAENIIRTAIRLKKKLYQLADEYTKEKEKLLGGLQ